MSRHSYNHVELIGNLGDAPEVFPRTGDPIGCNLSVATERRWKNSAGELQTETEWHRIVVFGGTARACVECLDKGNKVHVVGYLKTRKYQAADGQTRYSTEVVADRVGFLTPRLERPEGQRPRPQWERKR